MHAHYFFYRTIENAGQPHDKLMYAERQHRLGADTHRFNTDKKVVNGKKVLCDRLLLVHQFT